MKTIINKRLKFSTEVHPSDIYNVLSKNYINLITDYFDLQRVWLNNAYLSFKDLDKYFILITLVSKTFDSYAEYFVKYNFEQFYSTNEYELKKFNIINISKKLKISKETARRKIIELEKIGLLKKNKKAIILKRNSYALHRPESAIQLISKFLSKISKNLKKNNVIKDEISSADFEILIKNNFTQCWNYFIKFQIKTCTNFKEKWFKDYETFQIWGIIVYNQNLALNRKLKMEKIFTEKMKDSYLDHLINLPESIGLNAMTISDLTGIPRPTVIRKLKNLVNGKFIKKNKNGLFEINRSQIVEEINDNRLENLQNISEMSSKMFNTARFLTK